MEKSANSSDYPICVCFQQEEINYLFAELLQSRGVDCRIVEDPSQLSEEIRVITEPCYYHAVKNVSPERKLFVGSPQQLAHVEAIRLTQPLTEKKIESAISQLIG